MFNNMNWWWLDQWTHHRFILCLFLCIWFLHRCFPLHNVKDSFSQFLVQINSFFRLAATIYFSVIFLHQLVASFVFHFNKFWCSVCFWVTIRYIMFVNIYQFVFWFIKNCNENEGKVKEEKKNKIQMPPKKSIQFSLPSFRQCVCCSKGSEILKNTSNKKKTTKNILFW